MHNERAARSFPYAISLATAGELEADELATGAAQYRTSRLAARRAVLATYPEARPFHIDRRERSAPRVVGAGKPIALSLTHRDGFAAAVAALEPARVGIDLERDGSIPFDQALYFLTAREQRTLGTVSLSRLWALKEAAWKALALPDDTGFHDLELVLDEAGALQCVVSGAVEHQASATVTAPWPGYVLATVFLAGVQ